MEIHLGSQHDEARSLVWCCQAHLYGMPEEQVIMNQRFRNEEKNGSNAQIAVNAICAWPGPTCDGK